MKELGSDDPADVRGAGAIDLPTLQRYLNFWFSSSLDLFGAEISSNAATYFADRHQGPARRGAVRRSSLHRGQRLRIDMPDSAAASSEEVPLRNAMNEVTRAPTSRIARIGIARWNRLIAEAGREFRLALAEPALSPLGRRLGRHPRRSRKAIRSPRRRGARRQRDWLPTEDDRAFVKA